MKTWKALAAAAALLLSMAANAGELAVKSYAQGEFSYATGPAPAFAKVRDIPATWNAPSASLPGNWRNWVNDTQIDRSGKVRMGYYDRSYEARSNELVGSAAKFQIQFNPLYQKLTIHRVELRREGKWSERFDATRVSLARREERFEQNMADGMVTAMILLADVRAGDVVRIAYSIEGSNPILAGSEADLMYLAWVDPTLERHVRLLYPAGSEPQVRRAGGVAPKPQRVGDHVEVLVDLRDVASSPDEGGYPTWYERLPLLEVAPQRTWTDVVAWALPLYPEAKLPPELEARVAEWSKIADPHARAFEALRTVQRDVRYFGTEMGDNTHRPAAPADTWEHRYGDCKDKAYLLATLLHRLGIEAEPALVSLDEGKGIGARLPSAAAFDHVIVRARIEGKPFWLDGTLSEQHGDLRKLDVRDYGLALPVVAGSKELVPVLPPDGVANNTIVLVESFAPDASGDSIDLRVETTYTGLRAESMRYRLNAKGIDELGRDYSNFYQKRYSELEVAEPIQIDDNANAGNITTREHYRLKNAWVRKLGSQRQLDIYADALSGDATLPSTMERKGPLGLARRSSLEHKVVLEVPKGWSLPDTPSSQKFGTAEFSYVRSASASGNRLELKHRLEVLADNVSTEHMQAYLREMRQVRDDMDMRLTMQASGDAVEAERSQRLQQLLRDAAQEGQGTK